MPHDTASHHPSLVALGEALVDISPLTHGATLDDGSPLHPAPGGAPANVAVAAAKLGARSSFLGAVGDDPFGRLLRRTLGRHAVDVTGVVTVPVPTAVAFVAITAGGEREFMFYGRPGAHDHLSAADVDAFLAARPFTTGDVLHLGSNCLIHGHARDASHRAVDAAIRAGTAVSFDVNLRLALWERPVVAEVRAVIEPILHAARLVKLSLDELEYLTGGRSQTDAQSLANDLIRGNAALVCVTLGAAGTWYVTRSGAGHVPGYAVAARDTTGAGDAFAAAVAVATLGDPEVWSAPDPTVDALRRACAYAALSTTQPGAIPSYPSRETLAGFMATHGPP